jgi:hypothetical protein
MTALSILRPEVLPYVSECPSPLVNDAILKAVIEFCNRSRAYRFRPADITVVASTANYAVSDLPTGYGIASILSAELDDADLDLPDPGSVPLSWTTEEGTTTAAVVYSDTQIGLRMVPDVAGTLAVRLALRPLLTATTFPDDFNNLYQEHLAAGALAKLYAQPKKPWSAPELVAERRTKFEEGIYAAEYRADRGTSSAPARTSLCLIGGR